MARGGGPLATARPRCRESGLSGILYDAEPYTPPYSQFLYRAQPQHEEHSFTEYCVQARQRGREVMQAVAEEYPELTIMTYRLFCDVLPVLDSGNPSAALEPSVYGLQPAFVDGWCDVLPPADTHCGRRRRRVPLQQRSGLQPRLHAAAHQAAGVRIAGEPREAAQSDACGPRHLPRRACEPAGFTVVHRSARRYFGRATDGQCLVGAGGGGRIRVDLRGTRPLVAGRRRQVSALAGEADRRGSRARAHETHWRWPALRWPSAA